jgi:imidazolonepropionase-like amidohydrolase
MRKIILVAGVLVLAVVPMSVSPAWAQTYAIRNARIVTVSGPTIPNGHILIQDGRITAVGPNISIPANAKVIDGKGLTAYPGMIDPYTSMGLAEIASIAATQDVNELGELNPHIKASAAINPNSEHIAVTRSNGITTVLTAPGGGLFGGQAAVINLNGWVTKELLVRDSAALIMNYPRQLRLAANALPRQRQEAEERRKKRVDLLKETLKDAQAYAKVIDSRIATDPNPVLRALVPAVKGEVPVMITADTEQEIREALDIAEEFKLKPIIVGGGEAAKVVELIKSRNVPVLFSGVMGLPRNDNDAYDLNYSTPGILAGAGVKFAFTTGDAAHVRDLPFMAGMAGAFGLSKEEALKAVTLYPAQILSMDAELGSIAEGRIANIMLTDGDPLEVLTKVKQLFVAGKPVELTNRQTELYEKYSRRP